MRDRLRFLKEGIILHADLTASVPGVVCVFKYTTLWVTDFSFSGKSIYKTLNICYCLVEGQHKLEKDTGIRKRGNNILVDMTKCEKLPLLGNDKGDSYHF